jgi:hypothetical protein
LIMATASQRWFEENRGEADHFQNLPNQASKPIGSITMSITYTELPARAEIRRWPLERLDDLKDLRVRVLRECGQLPEPRHLCLTEQQRLDDIKERVAEIEKQAAALNTAPSVPTEVIASAETTSVTDTAIPDQTATETTGTAPAEEPTSELTSDPVAEPEHPRRNPLERPNTRSWNEWVALINGSWRKGPEAFIETGKYLVDAKEQLPRDEFDSIIKLKLDFEASVARKLICIGSNPTIRAHGHKLPPCWTTIYDLSKLKPDILLAGIKSGAIHPRMKRKDVRVLAGKPEPELPVRAKPSVPITEQAVSSWLAQAESGAKQRIRNQVLADISDQELRESLPPATCSALVEHCVGQEIAAADVSAVLNAVDSSCRAPHKFNLAVTLTRLFRNASAEELNKSPALAAIERKLKANGRDRRDTVIALVSNTARSKRQKKRG